MKEIILNSNPIQTPNQFTEEIEINDLIKVNKTNKMFKLFKINKVYYCKQNYIMVF